MKTKTLKCKCCKERFTPINNNSLQKYCMQKDECITAHYTYVKTIQRKSWNKRKREAKEKLKTKQDYEKELEPIFNEFIRKRDKDKPCISCGKKAGAFTLTAGHYYPAGSYKNLRFDEDNVHGQCWWDCNKNKSGNLIEYRIGLINRIGKARVATLEAHRLVGMKYSIEELKEMKIHYKQKIKDL